MCLTTRRPTAFSSKRIGVRLDVHEDPGVRLLEQATGLRVAPLVRGLHTDVGARRPVA